MTILPPSTLIDRIYNLISTIANLLALFISSILLLIIIYRFNCVKKSNHNKFFKDIPNILSLNILYLLIVRCLFQFYDIDINTIKRNYFFVQEYYNSFSCQLRGYILLSLHVTLYWSYALHAFYRSIRVHFSRPNHFHRLPIYIYLLIPGEYLISFLTILPLFRGFNVIYLLPNEPYCTASYNELASLLYMPIVAFLLPLTVTIVCYFSILRKTSHSNLLNISSVRKTNRRHLLVSRRIIIIIMILSGVSLPLVLDLIIYLPKGFIDPYMNSIGWFSSTLNAVVLAISIPFINPNIQLLFQRKRSSNNSIT